MTLRTEDVPARRDATGPGGECPEHHRSGSMTAGLAIWLLALLIPAAAVVVPALLSPGVPRPTPAIAVATVLLGLLPGWLYLRFTAVRARPVWEEYVLNLHRLGMDRPQFLPCPPENSVYYAEWAEAQREAARQGRPQTARGGDPQSIYVHKFEAHYGPVPPAEVGRRPTVTLQWSAVLLVSTSCACLTLGWVAVLWYPDVYALANAGVAAADVADSLRFGFLGAYVFVLSMLVRRYFQGDLTANAYLNLLLRLISALIVVAVVDIVMLDMSSRRIALGTAFVVGGMPLAGFQLLKTAGVKSAKWAVASLQNDYPLSDLDGLNTWYETQLLEEGIEDMQSLSTANLVDVILHARIPVGRLVDWVDQAVLYLHLPPPQKRANGAADRTGPRARLRAHGIRTATSLEDAFRSLSRSSLGIDLPRDLDDEFVTGLRMLLNEKGEDAPDEPSVTECLLRSFHRQPNLVHVRNWRGDWGGARTGARASGRSPSGPPPRPRSANDGRPDVVDVRDTAARAPHRPTARAAR